MEYLRLEPLEPPLSRLALGTLGFSPATRDRDYAVLDAWVEAGGTVIDTAHVYEDGDAERLLGLWLRDRPGVRERLVIVTKGAHPDADGARVTPADIASDLSESVERLGGPVDLYLLHRDDPAVDVGSSSTRSTHTAARARSAPSGSPTGRCRGSRGECARCRPRRRGHLLQQPAPSLAVQDEPPWPDCLSATDAGRAPGTPAAGCRSRLVGAGGRLLRGSSGKSSLVYQNAANRERRARAEQLGRRSGHSANAVALAWVLAQPFPVIAIVGPHSVEHLRSSLDALDVALSAEEARWLNLEAPARRVTSV